MLDILNPKTPKPQNPKTPILQPKMEFCVIFTKMGNNICTQWCGQDDIKPEDKTNGTIVDDADQIALRQRKTVKGMK